MGWESSGVVGFDLGPLLQGQTRIVKVKTAFLKRSPKWKVVKLMVLGTFLHFCLQIRNKMEELC